MNQTVFLKIYHKVDLSELQKCRIFHKMNLKANHKNEELSQNELVKIAKMRCIKNYKKMSKQELLIALLTSKQSHAELYKSKSNNAEIEEIKIFLMR